MTLFSTSHDLRSADAPDAVTSVEDNPAHPAGDSEMAFSPRVVPSGAPNRDVLIFHGFAELAAWWELHARPEDAS